MKPKSKSTYPFDHHSEPRPLIKHSQEAAAQSMTPLYEKLLEEETAMLEGLMADIDKDAPGFIHGVGREFATKFYTRLSTEMKSRGFDVDPDFWPKALKKAEGLEPDIPVPVTGRNRAERRANASRIRKGLDPEQE